jgi:hypothetical protein
MASQGAAELGVDCILAAEIARSGRPDQAKVGFVDPFQSITFCSPLLHLDLI